LIGDNPLATAHPRIMKARETFRSWEELRPVVERMKAAIDGHDVLAERALLSEIVSGYQPADEIVDWIASRKRA
jgi:FlaA1/EpsC-like NDP-sugar epimerase